MDLHPYTMLDFLISINVKLRLIPKFPSRTFLCFFKLFLTRVLSNTQRTTNESEKEFSFSKLTWDCYTHSNLQPRPLQLDRQHCLQEPYWDLVQGCFHIEKLSSCENTKIIPDTRQHDKFNFKSKSTTRVRVNNSKMQTRVRDESAIREIYSNSLLMKSSHKSSHQSKGSGNGVHLYLQK